MTAEKRDGRSSGFVLVDFVAVLVVGLFIAGLLLVGGAETRRQAGLGKCIQQLRQMGVATGSYEADNAGLIWAFSWRAGDSLSQWDDLNGASNDLQAAANQTVDIIRRRADRPYFPRIGGWIPHVSFSYLVISDYLGVDLPWGPAACPEDEPRLCWQINEERFCECPLRPSCAGVGQRWPYSSSYEMGPTFYSEDGGLYQGQTHRTYSIRAGTRFGGKFLNQVDFPAAKAILWEQAGRHFGPKHQYHAYEEARLPILFVDGNVSVRATADANPGWHPLLPDDPRATRYLYRPADWEAPTFSGSSGDIVTGHYRWTRGGLAGRDFGGPEVWD